MCECEPHRAPPVILRPAISAQHPSTVSTSGRLYINHRRSEGASFMAVSLVCLVCLGRLGFMVNALSRSV
ncbi:hypothetical protein VOLCADRAFT_108753, partial [Volvox carteri f. nagariensis]